MIFFTVILVYLFIQVWGSGASFHHDNWFKSWCLWLKDIAFFKGKPGALLAAAISGPVIVVLILFYFLLSLWTGLGLLVAVPVVLYSLGRGSYRSVVDEYLNACDQDDWQLANEQYRLLADEDELQTEGGKNNWVLLHQAMLTAVSYKGFEKLFVVLFWFILLGPAGALAYRLTTLFVANNVDKEECLLAKKWLWLIEWPAARVLGLSLAFTGNFAGCFQAWMECLFCRTRSTAKVLTHYVKGALGLDGSENLSDVMTPRELRLTLSLFYRTWIFWMCLLAVAILAF